MKKTKPIEWVLLVVGAIVILYVSHFFSMRLNDHIYAASHSGFKLPSRIYVWHFSKIASETRINGETPIQYVIQNSKPLNAKNIKDVGPMVDLFLAKGVDINATSNFGLTAFHYAILDEDPVAIQLLIEKKGDVNQVAHVPEENQLVKATQIEGMTPLQFLRQRREDKLVKNEEKLTQIENILIAAGAKVPEKPKAVPSKKAAPVKSKNKKKHK